MPLTCDLRRSRDLVAAISVDVDGLLDFKQPHLHASLGRHIAVRAIALDEVSVVAHPFKQTLLPHRNAILGNDLRKIPDQDGGVRRRGHSSPQNCVGLHLLNNDILLLELLTCLQKPIRQTIGVVRDVSSLSIGEIRTMLADTGQHLRGDPSLELLCIRRLAR